MHIYGEDRDGLAISVVVSPACPHPTRHKRMRNKMIIAKSFQEESSFSQHINKESDDCTLLRSENLGESIRTISLVPTFPFFIQNVINTEIILLALAGA